MTEKYIIDEKTTLNGSRVLIERDSHDYFSVYITFKQSNLDEDRDLDKFFVNEDKMIDFLLREKFIRDRDDYLMRKPVADL